MTKADLLARIAQDAELTKRQAEKVVDTLIHGIQEGLRQGEHVTLVASQFCM